MCGARAIREFISDEKYDLGSHTRRIQPRSCPAGHILKCKPLPIPRSPAPSCPLHWTGPPLTALSCMANACGKDGKRFQLIPRGQLGLLHLHHRRQIHLHPHPSTGSLTVIPPLSILTARSFRTRRSTSQESRCQLSRLRGVLHHAKAEFR
ncbi:hypothetical protein BD410DRAFT_613206 [Rickenella mellea]|uniref:Uncharacterized protein n=1 Tax=Rickenella mellea TaxID=50990 RepID=A0A4Y7PMS3_9AGAM|nr:hypothetical protein BD410DRAFT_613206 [Rickenella mellea]